ncbi:MAG: 3-deoxy-7-phosphoheptulonate synthase [Thermodesulfobacteriota bacterium]
MLIVMNRDATEEQVNGVIRTVELQGFTAHPIPGGERTSIGVLYNQGAIDEALFRSLPGVKETLPVTKPFKLVSREFHPVDTVVRVGDVLIGGKALTIIGGPCAVESEEQVMAIAKHVKMAGGDMLRGGAFKPRTSPYAFHGLGEEGLQLLAKAREAFGLPIVTEVMDLDCFDMVENYADVIQIGTRNMQNFSLLRRAGHAEKPILLKRGMSATVDEWLMAAEYVMTEGNPDVILCERGVRTFVKHSRNTLDLSAIPVVRRESHLPIIVDPSHAAGYRDQVMPLARAAAAVSAHGLMIEVHHAPETAKCDGGQALLPDQFDLLCRQMRAIFDVSTAAER